MDGLFRPVNAPRSALPALTVENLLLAAAYFGAAKLGLLMAVAHPNATAVWPPSGIALAAILLYGYRLLPGVALGAFAANATTAIPILAAAGIAAGNTLEALAGLVLLRYAIGFRRSLTRIKDILGLVVVAAASSTFAASFGTLSLNAGGSLALLDVDIVWLTWWAGDSLGIIIVTPLVLVWAQRPRTVHHKGWLGEASLLVSGLVALNMIILHGAFLGTESRYFLPYLSFAFMVWVALRLSQREATTTTFIVSVLAVWGTTHGLGPFAGDPPTARLLSLGALLGVLGFMTLSLSVIASQRTRLWGKVRASNEFKTRLIESSPDCIKVLDLEGRLRWMNARGMAGLEVDDLESGVNSSWIEFWQGADRVAARAAVAAARGGRIGRFSGYLRTTVTGKLQLCDVVVSPIRDAQGRVKSLLAVSRDVTGHRRADESFRKSLDALHRSQDSLRTTQASLRTTQASLLISQRSLRITEAHKGAILESALDCVICIDHEGRVIEFNPAAQKTFGYRRDQIIGQHLAEFVIPPRFREAHARGLKRYLATGASALLTKRMELTAVRADGAEFPVEIAITPVRLNRDPPIFTAYLRDITDRKETEAALRHSEERYRSLVTATNAIVWTATARGAIVDDNPSWQAFTGQTPEEYEGWGWLNALHPDDRTRTVEIWRRALKSHRPVEIEDRLRHRDGRYRHMLVRAVPIFDSQGRLREWVGACADISGRKLMEQDLRYMACHDKLTDLPNRALFIDRLGQALARARRHKEEIAVLFLDLDGFKRVNDTLGHDVGDRLLKAVAGRLRICVRSSDTVARFGGDEFVIMLTNFARIAAVDRIAQDIVELLSKPVELNGQELFITTSIGISVYPRHGDDPHTLLKSADTAMYLAKQGGNRYRHFSAALGAKASRRLALEQELHRALAHEEFVLHYQPQIELASGQIDTVEALLRWRRPDTDQLVPPQEFIPVAEETGLIVPIAEWALRAACAQIQLWKTRRLAPVRLALNVSARQFHHKNMKDVIDHVLNETGIDHSSLELELTESILQTEEAEGVIAALAEAGTWIAIDDFGTGYSSLSYLQRFPVYKLKIDQSFIRDLPKHQNNAAISTAVIAMAHGLNLKVTAEGVETSEQLDFLRGRHCDGAQGYFVSRPLPAEDFAKLLFREGPVMH